MTTRIEHLDGRAILETVGPVSDLWGFVLGAICPEFECLADDVSTDQDSDGHAITVCGQPVARVVRH